MFNDTRSISISSFDSKLSSFWRSRQRLRHRQFPPSETYFSSRPADNVRTVSFRARRCLYLFMKYVVEIQDLLKNCCRWKEVVVESDYTYKKRAEHVYKVTYRINNRLLCLLARVKTVRWYIIRVGYKRRKTTNLGNCLSLFFNTVFPWFWPWSVYKVSLFKQWFLRVLEVVFLFL